MTDRGRFVWHELLTSNTKAAGAYYGKVIGWKTQDWPANPDYTLFTVGKSMMAGLMMIPADAKAMGVPPNWCTYVGVPDVDESARLAERIGGRVIRQPEDIPEVGRFSIVSDRQGAVFALFSSPNDSPEPAEVAIGDFSWHELATTDWEDAFEFYERLFGWEKTQAMDMGPELGVYQMYGRYGKTLGGMFNKPVSVPGPPFWLPYIKVKDARKAAELATKSGGKVINGPMEVPGGDWITQAMDPQGAMFAVHSVTPAAKPQGTPKARPARKAAAKKVAKRKVAKVARTVARAKRKVTRAKKRVVRKVVRAKRKVARRKGVRRVLRGVVRRTAARKVARRVRRTGRKVARGVRRTTRRVGRAVRRAAR